MRTLFALLLALPAFAAAAPFGEILQPADATFVADTDETDSPLPVENAAEPELNETERFELVYQEIEQSFRARGTSPQLLKSLMNALKQPIRDATRGPASDANVVDVRRIDEVMRRYIDAQDEEN